MGEWSPGFTTLVGRATAAGCLAAALRELQDSATALSVQASARA